MSAPSHIAAARPITDKRQLVDYLDSGLQAARGLAHRHRAREIRLPPRRPCAAVPYEGPDGIRALLEG